MWAAANEAFKKYAVFRGRADRNSFESFFMVQVIVAAVAVGLITVFSLAAGISKGSTGEPNVLLLAPLGTIMTLLSLYGLVIFLPSAALIVRRLHDTNRSGWRFWGWAVAYTLFFIAYIILFSLALASRNGGAMLAIQGLGMLFSLPLSFWVYVLLYWLAQPGSVGDNRFGVALTAFEPDGPADGLPPQASGFVQGVVRAWRQNWRNFGVRGRLSRSEYWCFHAVLIPILLLSYALIVVSLLLMNSATVAGGVLLGVGVLLIIATLSLSLVSGIRRLHDVDRCGWWVLVPFLLPLGAMAWLYLQFKPSIAGDNRFGPQPQPML